MNVVFEVGTAWRFECDRCGASYTLTLTGNCRASEEQWVFADCCPFCHNRDVRELGAGIDSSLIPHPSSFPRSP